MPELWIHPEDAEKYGISDEDWVWVESKRGKITAKALVTKGIAKGVVYMERFCESGKSRRRNTWLAGNECERINEN